MTDGMGMTQRKPMTVEEFLEWERWQELRYEFDGFQAVAMTGGTLSHAVISDNTVDAIRRRLKLPCRVFSGNVKILVAGRVRYPDATVTCSPIDGQSDILPNPVVVFEVLSPSTASVDRATKNTEYEIDFVHPALRDAGAKPDRRNRVLSRWRQMDRYDPA